MNKYKTAAYEVKSDIENILVEDNADKKPWQLLNYKLESRTLLATDDELGRIFKAFASERLGFEISGDSVYSPNLFVKLSGTHSFSSELMVEDQNAGDYVSRFNSTTRSFKLVRLF